MPLLCEYSFYVTGTDYVVPTTFSLINLITGETNCQHSKYIFFLLLVPCYIFNLTFQAGKVSCERMDSSCPALKCSHPARQKGECCPTCQGQYLNVKSNVGFFLLFVQIDSRNLKIEIMILTSFVSVLTDCEFEQEVHADGKVFVPAGSGPCLKCRCKVSVWGITRRKCLILEGTEMSQQKDINKSGLFFYKKKEIFHPCIDD